MLLQRVLLAGISFSILCLGCRRESPIEKAARAYRTRHAEMLVQAKAQTELYQKMSDEQIVRVNPRDGLGLGLQVEKTELHLGEPLRVHLAYENLGADGPVSATTCQGFSLGSEDEDTIVSTSASARFACPDGSDFNRDNNVPLPQGQLKSVNLHADEMKLTFDHSGQYLILAGWQSFRPREGLFSRGDQYSVMASNQLLITVR